MISFIRVVVGQMFTLTNLLGKFNFKRVNSYFTVNKDKGSVERKMYGIVNKTYESKIR